MPSYGINPSNVASTVACLIEQGIAFRYDPNARFQVLLPQLREETASHLRGFLPDPLVWVFITEHRGVFTLPEMKAKWEEDRKCSDERDAYWRDYYNSP